MLGVEGRIYVPVSKALRKKLRQADSIRIALELVDERGTVIATTPRQKITNPFA